MSKLDELTERDIEETEDMLEEAARFLLTPLPWWRMGKAWNHRRHELIDNLKTKAQDLRLQY